AAKVEHDRRLFARRNGVGDGIVAHARLPSAKDDDVWRAAGAGREANHALLGGEDTVGRRCSEVDAVANCHEPDPRASRPVPRPIHCLPRHDVADGAVRVDDGAAWRVAHDLDGWVKVILAGLVGLKVAWEEPR